MSSGGFRQGIWLYENFSGYVQVLVELANHVDRERAFSAQNLGNTTTTTNAGLEVMSRKPTAFHEVEDRPQ